MNRAKRDRIKQHCQQFLKDYYARPQWHWATTMTKDHAEWILDLIAMLERKRNAHRT